MFQKQRLLFSTLIALTSTGAALAVSEDVMVSTDYVHVPKGFDSNDNVEVIVTGELPNTCYRRPYGEVKVIEKNVSIDVKATKITDKNTLCIEAIVPFMLSVPVGQLDEGSYHVAVNPGTASEKDSDLSIEQPSSHGIDNFTYANVTSIKQIPSTSYVNIEGYHPSSCMDIERVEVVANQNHDTYSVMPIIKQTKAVCDRMIKPFSYHLELPGLNPKETVLHIRKIDGTALNFLLPKN